MSSMTSYKKEEKTENGQVSFSFSSSEKQVEKSAFLQKARSLLQDILRKRFNDHARQEIREKVDRINFCCPYCGDSHVDANKKRGNLYTSSLYYKCYNCGKYRNLENFFKDFQKDLDADEIVFVRESENKQNRIDVNADPSLILETSRLKAYAVNVAELARLYDLTPAADSSIKGYLLKRLQFRLERFYWNADREQLYIMHFVPDTDLVLGFQIRNFKRQPKYMTYKLSKIYEELVREVTDEIYEIDPISTTFGILNIDFSNPITVFEGPLDSFLYRNSVATCSAGVDVPIDFGRRRYLYDYDLAGKKASLQKSEEGYPVFLWRKLLEDMGIEIHNNKKMDLTDFLVYCTRKSIKVPSISNYFSTSKYDSYWI